MNTRASVISQPALRAPSFTPHSGLLQRKCGCSGLTGNCEECNKKKLQKKSAHSSAHSEAQTSVVPAIVNSVLNSPGQSLGGETRAFMESSLGHDFSQVRIHVDQKAAESARAVNALAYTVGSDVVFRESQYAPHTAAGRRLLAHELTHVVQQRGRTATSTNGVTLNDSPELEHEADRIADAAINGRPENAISSRGPQGVQRQPAAKPEAPATESAKAKPESSASACVESANGQEPESLTRMDTVTVIEICGGSTEPCAAVKADLGALCAEIAAKPQRVKFRVFHIDSELKENEKLVDRFGKGPQTLVYTERTRSLSIAGKPKDFLDQIRVVYKTSLKEGVYKGIGVGAGVGAAVGGVVGAAVGALGGIGGSILGGFLGSAIGAGVGILVGWAIGAATAEDIGAKPLSEGRKKEVAAYLEGLENSGNKVGGLFSDDLARDAVDQWVANKEKMKLSPRVLKALVLEMLDGTVSRDDQRAILKILENASDHELLQIFGVKDPPRLLDLEAVFEGTEKEYLLEVLEQLRKRFPVLAPTQKTTGLMIENPVVKATLAANFNETHREGPGVVRRECCGGFIQNVKTLEVFAEPQSPACAVAKNPTEQPDCPTNQLVHDGRMKYDKDHRIAASFHTHPLVTNQVRYAPSAADFQPGWGEPEHYVVDPFNVNLIQYADRKAIGFRILGQTSALLGVQRIEPPKQRRSTLELG